MPSYKLVVAYNGSRYSGFQRQTPNSQLIVKEETSSNKRKRPRSNVPARAIRTVQDCLEEALSRWTGVSIPELRLRVAGRTDKGVHATGQVVAVDIPADNNKVFEGLEEWEMSRALNSRLPKDISVHGVAECSHHFEPRHDVKRKQYTYTLRYRRLVVDKNTDQPLKICNGGPQTLRTAQDSDCLWLCPWPLNDSLMKDVCTALAGRHDFSCFVHKADRRKKDNVIDLKRFDVEFLHTQHHWPTAHDSKEANKTNATVIAPVCNVKFVLEAIGFRRSMVRNLVGFVVDVCRGLLSLDDIPKVLKGTNEGAAMVNSAPASGLCLAYVVYPEETDVSTLKDN